MITLKEKNDLKQNVWISQDKELREVVYRGEPDGSVGITVGTGPMEKLDRIKVKEIGAVIAKTMKTLGHQSYGVCVTTLTKILNRDCICDLAEGILLENQEQEVVLFGEKVTFAMENALEETVKIVDSILLARKLVNCPGNQLRPLAFAKELTEAFEGTGVETSQLVYGQLKDMGMGGLAGIGESSENPPCLYIMRYHGNPASKENIGLVGKGVTCDTGGYCLKPSGSMLGIKGDMAGGAAVAGAILALAKTHARVNVTGIIPMCENRISPSSLLPGDVITSYSGKTIEVLNTDAEGRLILADAVTYAVRDEKVTSVLDVATLTGAVVNLFGFTIGGVITDSEELKEQFFHAAEKSGEHYWQIPFYEEHEKMLENTQADIKNLGESHCGTITAGLFIRYFAEEKPWIHLDIAGTAWVDSPIYAFQQKGATGAAVSTLYYYCKNGENHTCSQ